MDSELADALKQDDAAEDRGMHGDDPRDLSPVPAVDGPTTHRQHPDHQGLVPGDPAAPRLLTEIRTQRRHR